MVHWLGGPLHCGRHPLQQVLRRPLFFRVCPVPSSSLSWSDHLLSTTTPDPSTVDLSASNGETLLPQFVQAAHANVSRLKFFSLSLAHRLVQNTKAILTVGGWTGSQYFSSLLASNDSQTTFVNTLMSLVKQYDLDGLDFE